MTAQVMVLPVEGQGVPSPCGDAEDESTVWPSRLTTSRPMFASFSRQAAAILFGVLLPGAASAQLIPIKTLPLAQGDQFAIFPSANEAMGGVSIAIRDS